MTFERIKKAVYFKGSLKNIINSTPVRSIRLLFPTSADNIKQLSLKLLYLLTAAAVLISTVFYTVSFSRTARQNSLAGHSRRIWSSASASERMKLMRSENKDFIGWLKVGGTNIDCPVFQSRNDRFYLTHNQKKKKDSHGALHITSADNIKFQSGDQHITVFGNNMKDGTMFGTLDRYKNLYFYRNNPNLSFSTFSDNRIYKIFAVFILNSDLKDDNNYVFNAFRSSFESEAQFQSWLSEIKSRSILDIGTEILPDDSFLSLAAPSDEFEGALTVVMARKVRPDENFLTNKDSSRVNPQIKYPKRWYDNRKLKYPY